MRMIHFSIWLFCAQALFTANTFALEPVYSDHKGRAISGYDPVSYLDEKKARRGESTLTYRWNGADWYFSSPANQQKFMDDPEKYAPQYGGYCAWAVSKGYTAKTDPDAWHVKDGKLYLSYNRSVRRTWKEDIPGNVAKADRNWPNLLSEND